MAIMVKGEFVGEKTYTIHPSVCTEREIMKQIENIFHAEKSGDGYTHESWDECQKEYECLDKRNELIDEQLSMGRYLVTKIRGLVINVDNKTLKADMFEKIKKIRTMIEDSQFEM